MRGQKILFSHKKDDWETPQELFNQLTDEFRFNWDAAADKLNCKVSGECYFSENDDALINDWNVFGIETVVFCNPPYSKWQKFVKKAHEQSEKFPITIVMLLPARTDTKAFHNYIYNNPNVEIRFIKGRLKFEIDGKPVLDKNNKPQSAPFPSMIVIFKKG